MTEFSVAVEPPRGPAGWEGSVSEICCIADYVDALRGIGVGARRLPFWFRGLASINYNLAPSVARNSTHKMNESAMLKRFMQDAHAVLGRTPSDRWEWLFLAQHHGVPTRLLDWSENALISLFFATEKGSTLEGLVPPDGLVWILQPNNLNRLSGWSGLHSEDLPMIGVDTTLERYHPFEQLPPQEALPPMAAIAPRTFGRIQNQWGTFTVSTDMAPLEMHRDARHFMQPLLVPAEAKQNIRSELEYVGIQERVVYPDLHRLGARVRGMFE